MWAMKEFYLTIINFDWAKSNESKEEAAKRGSLFWWRMGSGGNVVVLLNLRSDPWLQPMTSNVPSFSSSLCLSSLDHLDRRTVD
jgi:hypothetical protein